MRPGHFDHRINNGTGIGSIDRIAEQLVLSSYCKRTDRVFTQIVCKAAGAGEQFGGLLGYDSYEGDYFGIDCMDAWSEDEAKKKLKQLTKDDGSFASCKGN